MTTRPVSPVDLAVLIGLLAVLEGHLMIGDVDEHVAGHLRRRVEDVGLLPAGSDERGLRQALNDLNHRLRYALGEYDTPPVPEPVP
jgi:hypothetical protein